LFRPDGRDSALPRRPGGRVVADSAIRRDAPASAAASIGDDIAHPRARGSRKEDTNAMADTPTPNGNGGATAQPDDGTPTINALAQYTKDLSFENPNAPRSLQPQENGPQINIQVNVNAKQIADIDFEVELTLEGDAKIAGEVLFAFELTYAGIFRMRNIPQDQLHPAVMIECPRLLFPFARQIVAESVRNGGFPPLYIDPIDFVGLYRQKAMESQAQGEAGPLAS
jgi:preprotein translocase subunit SecB